MTMTKTTTMMMMMMMMMQMVVVTLVAGQRAWPERPVESSRDRVEQVKEIVRRNQLNVFREFFFVDFSRVNSDLYNQLFLSDDEAAEACQAAHAAAFIKTGGISAPHPRTCFASLVCAGTMFNSMTPNTPHFYQIQVRATSPGTYYNPDSKLAEFWTVDNRCDSDPCKTQRNMTTARSCDTYVTCEPDGQGVLNHQERRCPDGHGFSVLLDVCIPDANCTRPLALNTVNLRCYATGRPREFPEIPGVPDTAYYNRTYQLVETGEVVTVKEMCPASLVFDSLNVNSTQLCKCVPAPQEACRNLTLINVGNNTPRPWAMAVDPRVYKVGVVDDGGVNHGWARFFTNVDYNYYDAQALALNELAGDWALTFRFQLDPAGGNPATFSLAQNSLDPLACPDPSFRVSVVNFNALRVDVIPRGRNWTTSVQLDNILNPAVSEPIQVVVRRQGDTLVLQARNRDNAFYLQNSVNGLGQGPLTATSCGLVFGQEFSGWLESVRLDKDNC